MLTTEQHWTAPRVAAAYRLRLHGGTEDERLITIPPGKHSVGSGPRCQIRLTGAGIQAMECLLVRDKTGLRARRWSDRILLNGQPFEESGLAAGDVLSVGPVELEVVGPADGEMPVDSSAPMEEAWENGNSLRQACDGIDDIFLMDESSSQVLQPTEPNRDWQEVRSKSGSPRGSQAGTGALAAALAAPNAVTKSTVRRRSRRALDALRQQRRNHDELISRVNALERLLAAALAEPGRNQVAVAATADQDESEAGPRMAILEGELASFREELVARDGELQQARYSIDVLERQLIDSQHTMHAFADERTHWEQQFNELESRLAEYVERIQELERQLEAGTQPPAPVAEAPVAVEPTPAPDSIIDWEAEAALASDVTETAAKVAEAAEEHAVATAVETPPEDAACPELDWQEVVEEPATVVGESTVETAIETIVEPTGESPSDQVEVAELPGEVPTGETGETDETVDEALDHLRGLSIWREEGNSAEENRANSEPPDTAEKRDEPSGGGEPASFLDRYAHLFPEDETARPESEPEDNTALLTEAVPPPEVHADEESVEQYMAKLLARMRGGPAGNSVVSSYEQPPNPSEPRLEPTLEEPQPPEAEQPKFTHLNEMKTRASAPEQASDMAAMRALANQSARHAIGVHAARKLRRTAITRMIVTALAASVSVYLLLNSETLRSMSFAAGSAAGFAAAYWGFLTLGTLLKGFQLGAFDDIEEEDGAGKASPPLPIDVENATEHEALVVESAEQPNQANALESAGGADVVKVS